MAVKKQTANEPIFIKRTRNFEKKFQSRFSGLKNEILTKMRSVNISPGTYGHCPVMITALVLILHV